MTNRRLPILAVLLASACLAACASHHDRDERVHKPGKDDLLHPPKTQVDETQLRAEAYGLYLRAHKQMDEGDYVAAIKLYDDLVTGYPFTEYGTQAELEKAFSEYKATQSDDALASIDHFLRDHPRHPKADYAQYLRGLVNFDRDHSLLGALTGDDSKRDVGSQISAFADFSLLVQKYPRSPYIGDARLRMAFLRNHIARHELSVMRFYMHRNAYLAAAKRGEAIIADYPGAPATAEALKLVDEAYRKLGLRNEEQNADKLLAANPGLGQPPVKVVNTSIDRNVTAGVAVDNLPPPPPAPSGEPETKQSHGIFSKFAGLFSFLDTTKPENQYVITIPTGHPQPTTTTTTNSDGSTTTTVTTPPANEHHLHVSAGPDDPAEKWTPGAQPAATGTAPATPAASGATPAVVPAAGTDKSKPASTPAPATPAPAPAAQPPAEHQGAIARFFSGFVSLFSFLDPDHAKH